MLLSLNMIKTGGMPLFWLCTCSILCTHLQLIWDAPLQEEWTWSLYTYVKMPATVMFSWSDYSYKLTGKLSIFMLIEPLVTIFKTYLHLNRLFHGCYIYHCCALYHICTWLCVYILLLLSCFGCSQYILLLSLIRSSFYHNHTI